MSKGRKDMLDVGVETSQSRMADEIAGRLDGLPVEVVAEVVERLYRKHGGKVIRLSMALDVADSLGRMAREPARATTGDGT